MSTPWWTILTAWEWAAVGPCVVGVGLVIAWFAGDRSRGRKRCPKCWYDMSGAVLGADGEGILCRCPECGRGVRSERELGRGRRKAWHGVGGVVLLGAAYGILVTPRVRDEGWKGVIPNAALIVGVWISPRQPEELETVQRNEHTWERRKRDGLIDYSCEMLTERMRANEVWSWQKELAARLAIRRVDRQLDQWPPKYDDGLSHVIETALGLSWSDDSDRTAHLVALSFEFPKTVVAGCPVPVIVDSVCFGPSNIVAEITAGWPGAKPVIIQTMSPTGRVSRSLSSFRSEYFRQGNLLDSPPEPCDSIQMTVRLRRTKEPWYKPAPWMEPALRTRVYMVPLNVLKKDIQPLMPVESVYERGEKPKWRSEIVRSYLASNEVVISILDQSRREFLERAFPEGLGVGVRAELLKNGVVHGSAFCTLSGNTTYPHCTPMGSMGGTAQIRIPTVSPHTADSVLATLDQWSIRLVGDECAARQDFDATSYWAGEMTLPLEPASHR